VGKSELLREYARRQEARYPAGRYWIDCRLNLAQELASLGRQCLQMAWLDGPLEEQAIEVLQHLAKEPVLLLFDNATDEEQVQPFLPPAGQAHVLLSSTSRDWGPPLVEEWRPEGLQRLDPHTALAVLESVAGKAVAEQVGGRVIAELGGLPVHLLPTARTLARKSRNGRLSEGQLVQLSKEGIDSFSIAWQALDPAAMLLLQSAGRWFNPNALVEAELVAALAESFQGEAVMRNAVDACRDLYLLQGEGRLAKPNRRSGWRESARSIWRQRWRRPWERRPNAWRRHPPMGRRSRLCSATSWAGTSGGSTPRVPVRKAATTWEKRFTCWGSLWRRATGLRRLRP
jgi:hypothetical protein